MASVGDAAALGDGFSNAYDLAFSLNGRIFVLNRYSLVNPYYAGRISICTFDEEYLGEFNIDHGDGHGQCKVATAMAFDSEDRLHIVDEYTHRVLTVDTSGAFLGQWGERGDGAGQLNGPTSIAFDSEDNCYIVEQHNHRIQKFTRDGKYLHHWGGFGDGDGQFNMPWGVTLDPEGNVWVADWRNDRVQKFTPDGRFLARYGQSGDGDGQFHRPSSVAVDDEGYIYVADWGNERVQVLGPDGGFVQKLRGQATMSKWGGGVHDRSQDGKRTAGASRCEPDPSRVVSTRYPVPGILPDGALLLGDYKADSGRRRPPLRDRVQPKQISGIPEGLDGLL